MRIWIINHYAAPPILAGGTRHYNFAKQLIQRGHDVTLIASNYNHFSHSCIGSKVSFGEVDHTYDVPFIWIPTPAYKGNTFARFQNMLMFSWRLLRQKYLPLYKKPDVIIGSSPHLFAALGGELLATRLKIPFILEIRDLWPESLIDLGRLSTHHPLIKLMRFTEKYLYRKANRIISLLPAADKYLNNQGVQPEHILWLPNAIDTEVIPTNMIKSPSDKFTVMYAGAHGVANDLDTIIFAANILQNQLQVKHIKICLIGDGPEKVRLKELAGHLKLTIVHFYDAVAKNEIYSTLNEADAFIMLLKDSPVFRWGISPNKLFDYLVMARPVIFGVDTPFNPIRKHHAGLSIKPSDPEALATAIYELSKLPKDELNAMGLRGKEYVIQHHHIKKLTDSLEHLIYEAIEQSSPESTKVINKA